MNYGILAFGAALWLMCLAVELLARRANAGAWRTYMRVMAFVGGVGGVVLVLMALASPR